MDKFRNGTIDILVATDVAARGIDVDDVECVINYELPQDEEYYVHRIGRTGRAGRDGIAFSFVFGRDMRKLKDIERYTKSKIMKHSIPTVNDVEQKKTTQFFAEVKATLEEGNFAKQLQWVEDFINEEDYSLIDICAAMLRNSMGAEEKEEIKEETYSRRNNGTRNNGGSRRNDENMTRLFLNVGKNQKIQAKDILGAIAGETGINSKYIGSIDIYDKYTFVDIDQNKAKMVIEKMKSRKIRGNKLNIERANVGKRRRFSK